MVRHRRPAARALCIVALGLGAVACSASSSPGASSQSGATVPPASLATTVPGPVEGSLFDTARVHDVSMRFDDGEYRAMLAAFEADGTKGWLRAEVTLDATTYRDAGVRLKGNSSLFALQGRARPGPPSAAEQPTGDEPSTLPWLIRLDKYVEGQGHEGMTELVVRSNTSRTSLNEAVALELLGEAGLATQRSVAVRFSANDGAPRLRLMVENPDDDWDERVFGGGGVLYKAETGGDYSYRGPDPAAYDEVFDQESGPDEVGLAPLIEFLDFLNNADDESFERELPARFDVGAFARYLAFEELIANNDDIDGLGNNSFLRLDPASGAFTIVAWDHNLAFRSPVGEVPPGDTAEPRDENPLVARFLGVAEFEARHAQEAEQLRASVYRSGLAERVLARWAAVLAAQASDLVEPVVVERDAGVIRKVIEKAS